MKRIAPKVRSAWRALNLLLCLTCVISAGGESASVKVLRFFNSNAAELSDGTLRTMVHVGERFGKWSIMEISTGSKVDPGFVALEDFTDQRGSLALVDAKGIRFELFKSLEATWADAEKLYLGHSLNEVIGSASDLLGDEILSRAGDPDYETVAPVFPPITRMSTYSFVGTPGNADKVGFNYGGRSPNFDPAPYYAPIGTIREQGRVMDGIVGGHLPVLRFVYPETNSKWTEMVAFAPFREVNGNDRIQPVWYRIVHIENGSVGWSRYIDSYHPFPPRTHYDSGYFYRDLVELRAQWNRILTPAMKVEVPDARLADLANFSLVREMMTRVAGNPKYGVVDRDYGGSEHDGFPDTFTVGTAAMLEWGLVDVAGRYIENYLGKFVRDDGSLLYRGPEIGQYGRMLTVLAQYVNYGGDPTLLLRYRSRIDGITRILLGLRDKAKQLPKENAAYGMIAGWSEADASLDSDPSRYMQPYFSNSAEAARGFRDLGRVWTRMGKQNHALQLSDWGNRLIRESDDLLTDLHNAMSRSLLRAGSETILPSIAGVPEPFHVVVPRDAADPQFRSYRAYVEMMYSGLLTGQEVEEIVRYRKTHHDTVLGVPTAYGFKTGDLAGFLSYGHGYGLIQYGMRREALLMLYAIMAHQYTRGTWMAPETRPVFNDTPAAPYCTPAQLVVPLMAKWMLVFEDPQSEILWLGKGAPNNWFEDGKKIAVSNAPTRWGRVGFSTESRISQGTIQAVVNLPSSFRAELKLRLGVTDQREIRSVEVNGRPWSDFNAKDGVVTIRAEHAGKLSILARY